MAEKIGEAYVRIVYSGEGAHLSKDIRDDLERDAPAFEAIGEEHSKAYNKGFKKEINKDADVSMETLRKALDKGTGKMEATGGKASSALMDGLERDLRDKFGDDVAKVMANSLRDRLKRGGSFEDVQKELSSSLEALVRDATAKLQAGEKKTMAEQTKFEKDFRDSLDKIESDAKRAWTDGSKAAKDYRRSLENLDLTNARVSLGLGKLIRKQDEESKKTREQSGWLHRVNKELDGFADKVGAGFGRGSRNNFLNFIGSMVRNSLNLVGLFPKLIEGVSTFASNFNQVRKVEGLFAAIAPAALTALGGITALAIGITALILVIGPVVVLLSGLLGILVALASTVLLAAVAGVAALAGAFVPLAVGIGATVLALASFQKATATSSKAAPQLVALKNIFHDLGTEVAKPLFKDFGTTLHNIGGILHSLFPLAHAAGVGMRDFFAQIGHGMESPAFHQFIAQFSNILPGMLHKLGRIFSNTFAGIGGVFRGMIPLTQSFLGWLEKITGQFKDWANSSGGRQEIRQFLRDAADSAKSLGDFLGQAGGLLMDLINNGKSAGDNMFDGMTRAIEKFRKFLKEPVTAPQVGMAGRKDPLGELPKPDPGGSLNRLDEWFNFAQKLADALGTAVVNAGKLMGDLSNKDAQDNLLTILDILNKITGLIGDFTALWNSGFIYPLGKVVNLLGQVDIIGWLKGIQDNPFIKQFDLAHLFGLDKLPSVDWGHLFHGLFPSANGAKTQLITTFAGVGPKILSKIGNVNVSGIIRGASTALGNLLGTFVGAAGKVLNKISPVNVAGIIVGAASALSKLLGTFTGTAGKILNKVSPVNVSGIFTGAAAAVTNLLGAFAGLGGRILSEIGHIDIGSLMHGSIDPPGPLGPWSWAAGGIADHEMIRRIGEDGAEAVVPLNRPLSQVDPSVRWLSAIAQGKGMPAMADGGVVGSGRTVNVGGITVISPQADPHAVAVEAINHLVAVGY